MQLQADSAIALQLQGEQLVVFGGEYFPEADENQTANTASVVDEDEDRVAEVSNELCLLEPDMKLWVTVDITGVHIENGLNPLA